jgi:hypothetical protein
MTRGYGALAVTALLLVGLALGNQQSRQQQQQLQQQYGSANAKPFQAGYEYTFTYNGQISTGLKDGQSAASEPQQQASTRIQTQCKIQFQSNRHATLRLEQIRIGYLNQLVQNPQQVKPMGMFEQKQIESEKRAELQLPTQFSYVDGVVERIEFHSDDSTWSKNIKRAVLNMIQLNLKRNNAQGSRQTEEVNAGQKEQQQVNFNGMDDEQQGLQQASAIFAQNSFTLPEMTIEGECQTTYTVNKNQQQRQQQKEGSSSSESNENDEEREQQSSSCPNCFNVTKSIDFKKCSKIADVAFGYQTQQLQPQCAQCQQQWQQQQQQNGQQGQQQQQLPHPCDQCDPKEVKEHKLDRSTVLRYVLQGKKQQYGIKRVELLSQYVYKSLRSETGQYGAALQAIVASELVLRGAQQCNSPKCSNYGQKEQQMKANSEQSESLLYSNAWDVEEKRFYMYGDEEFVGRRSTPFAKVQNKAEQAAQAIHKIASAASDKSGGIEVEVQIQLQRLAELLRMCSVEELKNVQALLSRSQQGSNQQRGDIEQQKVEHIFADALAIAGTRNTIYMLVEKILNHQISPTKAAQTLNGLNGLPAPSDAQVDQVLRLCKNEICHRSAALKQSCWLTFGAMVGELCQHKTQKNAQQSVFGAQSGFSKEEVCPMHKKEIYKQTMIEQFEQAETTYEQVLALKALGNAGLDIAVNRLEQIIQNQRINRIPRIQAIDALRRLRDVMPRKIQRVLLPIFQNTKEQPEVRMAAFAMIMHTQPEQPIVDQISFTLTKERSKQVQSYVYTTMTSLSQSQVPCKQQLAKHLKNALKLANVDESTLRSSLKYQIPIYNHEQKEGIFMTLSSVFNKRNTLPTHLSARIDTMLNDEFGMNALKIGFTQKDIEGWYERLMQMWGNKIDEDMSTTATRGQRSQRRGQEELRKIFSGLSIKKRQSSYSNNQNEQQVSDAPFAMLCLRVGDVDQLVVPVDQQHMPSCLKSLLRGEKPSLSGLLNEQQHFRFISALNPLEKSAKIPTSCGIPIRLLTSTPILAAIEGQLKIVSGGNGLESQGPKVQINVHATITGAHIQKVETWLPIFCVGVESIRSVEINLPIQAVLQANQGGQQQMPGLQITFKIPQAQKTRVFGLHTLPVTYVREFDPKTKMLREPRVKTIHNEQLEQLQREVNKVVGEHTLGLPFHVKGHYHVPANPTDYQQIVQMAMATENQVHVTFEPVPETTPKEIRLRINAQAFQKIGSEVNAPELGQFYTNSVKFEHAYPEDFADMDVEEHNQRREKLNNFLGQYKPQQVYKHQLKASVETVGGRKQCKAQMEVKGQCDSQFKFCKAQVDIQRSPIYANEQGPWTLKSNIQIVTPESVSSVQQLGQLAQKHKQFVCMAETQWGSESSGPKQHINLRIQGESAKNSQWRQIEENESQLNKYYKKRTAFLNKFDAIIDYKLKPEMQNCASRCFEALKAYNFWNTQSQLLSQQQSGRDGQVHATLVIDPITQQHANLSVKTPTQAVRIQSVQLLTKLRPFPLVRQNPQKSTHSFSQLFSGLKTSGRAECKVDGQRVNTFDDVIYKAPISKCYSVLAKDCSSDEPQFAVLMKCQQSSSSQGCSSQQGKKLQVLTQQQVIECQPKQNQQQQQQQKLQCKINGQIVQEIGNGAMVSSSESNYNENSVEYDNEEQTSVTINVAGVWVRFNGKKAVIKISNMYKNGQCGLCGNYNDESEDVLRMNNNELTSNLQQFHQSYSFQNDECTKSEQSDFYKQHTGKFEMQSQEDNNMWQDEQQDQGYESSSNSQENSSNDDEEQNEDDSWWGQSRYSNKRSSYGRRNSQQQQKKQQQKRSCWPNCEGQQSGEQGSQWTEEPVKATKVIEYNHKICFSVDPVRQCPEGTTPAGADGQPQYGSASNEEDTPKQQPQQQKQGKKMQFTCLPRSSVEARRLQRQARRGVVVDVSALSPSFVENVKQPQSCIRY